MKSVYYIWVALCCGTISLSAQEYLMPDSSLTINTDIPEYFSKNLDAYVGTWEYRAGADVFRIVLKKDKRYGPDGEYRNERVYGGHVYMRDGEVVSNCIQIVEESTTLDDETMTISANNAELKEEYVEINELRLAFKDRIKNKYGLGTLTLIPATPQQVAQLHWKINREPEKVYLQMEEGESFPASDPTWSVPTDLILTKIE
jgi:hypothetical protein